jgi:hypothetical protein
MGIGSDILAMQADIWVGYIIEGEALIGIK